MSEPFYYLSPEDYDADIDDLQAALKNARAERDAALTELAAERAKNADLSARLDRDALVFELNSARNTVERLYKALRIAQAERDALAHDPNNDRALIRLRRSQVKQYKRARRYTRRYVVALGVINRQGRKIDGLESELAGRRMDTSNAFI